MRSRIACTTGIRWLNTSLEVLLIGGGGAIFNVVWKVLPVPSVGAGFLSIRRLCVVLVLLQRSRLPLFCAVSGCRTCLCGDNTYVVCMYY